jgi:tetratricopeptide (TPR) repeat protein
MPERALPLFERVLALDPSAAGDEPADQAWGHAVAEAQSGRSLILHNVGRGAEARAAAEDALARRERLLAQNPADTQARLAVLRSYAHLGAMCRDTGALDEGKAYMIKSAEQAELLAALDPTMTSLDSERYGVHDRLAVLCLDLGQLDEAERYGEKAITIAQSWAAREHTPNAQARFGYAVTLKGRIQMQRKQYAEAKTSFEQALAVYSALREQTPGEPVRMQELAATHTWLAFISRKLQDKAAALGHQKQALELYEQLARLHDDMVEHAVELARARLNLASAYLDLRTPEGDATAAALLEIAERTLHDLRTAGKLVGWERDYQSFLDALAMSRRIIARRQAHDDHPTTQAAESDAETPTTGPS